MTRTTISPLVIEPGELRHSIQIQQQTATQSASGAPRQDWSKVLSTRAKISTASSREVYQAAQFTEQVTHVVTIRWPGASVAIQGGMQVLFGSRVFKIQAVENVEERNRVLRLRCLEINGVQ